MYKCHVTETALEIAKTLLSTPQPELLELAAINNLTDAEAIASLAFEFADAFHKEEDKYRNK